MRTPSSIKIILIRFDLKKKKRNVEIYENLPALVIRPTLKFDV